MRERGILADDLPAALRNTDDASLAEVFSSFGMDLGTFVQPSVLSFGADAVLATGWITNVWERFAALFIVDTLASDPVFLRSIFKIN